MTIGLAHPFRDQWGRPAAVTEGRSVEQLLAAWRQAEMQGRTVVHWYLSRRYAQRLARETWGGPLNEDLPARLFGMPAELVDAPDGFGMVCREEEAG